MSLLEEKSTRILSQNLEPWKTKCLSAFCVQNPTERPRLFIRNQLLLQLSSKHGISSFLEAQPSLNNHFPKISLCEASTAAFQFSYTLVWGVQVQHLSGSGKHEDADHLREPATLSMKNVLAHFIFSSSSDVQHYMSLAY